MDSDDSDQRLAAMAGFSFKPVEEMSYEEAMEELIELSNDRTTQMGLESIIQFAADGEGDIEGRPMSR